MTHGWIQPMEPVSRTDVAGGGGWLHEIKWDGIRGMVYVGGGGLKIYTKRGNERTGFYPELAVIPRLLKVSDAVLDGEIVIFDENGNPSFYSSLLRERVRNPGREGGYSKRYPARYIIFDILSAGGKLLINRPLSERRRILEKTVGINETVAVTDQYENGEDLFSLMKAKGWEGIVSKRSGSLYVPGKKHNLWYKTKYFKKLLAVVGGMQWKDGMPNALLLGIYKAGELIFVGKAATGLSQEHIYLLKENYSGLEQKDSPFGSNTVYGTGGPVTWLKPILTCWIGYMEFTNDGVLRHPKILGFSTSAAEEADGREMVL